jgi:hypothetical protein
MEVRDGAAARASLRLPAGVWIPGAIVALGIMDLAARQLARRSLLEWVGAGAWSSAFVLAVVLVSCAVAALLVARAGVPRRADRVVVLLLIAAFASGLVAQQALGARLQSDGFYYFAYLRSLWFDHDVDFANDYRALGLGDKTYLFAPTPTGHAQSAWTIGPALVWSPFFAGGDLVAARLSRWRPDVARDGTSFPYRQAICVAGLFYGLLGVWFCYRLAALFVSERLAAVAAFVVIAGSFMVWYLVKEPTMTHAPSMAAVALFTYGWAATRGRRTRMQWALLGVAAGVATLVRWQNALFALLPAIEVAQVLLDAARARDRRLAVRTLTAGVLFTLAAILAFLPQMLAWKAIYGSYLAVSPIGPSIQWADPALANILWSSRNGLFSTTPILYLAALGLVGTLAVDRRFAVPALVAFGAMAYFNAAILDWWGSASFGMRRFDGVIPLLVVGLAVSLRFVTALVARRPRLVVGTLVGLLILWNLALMQVSLSGVQATDSFTMGDVAASQVRVLHGWFGYPFSYPANLLYAARYGVSPARYDVLAPFAFLGDPRRPYGKVDLGAGDQGMLGEGWHGPEREGAVTFRWASSRADLLVPLHHAADLAVQVRLQPFMFTGAAPQTIRVGINGTSHGPFTLAPGWQDVRFDTPRGEWHAGPNRVVLEFSRQQAPAQVGVGGDERMLSAEVDFLRIQQK